jgi:iron complex outermembrane receptor protein
MRLQSAMLSAVAVPALALAMVGQARGQEAPADENAETAQSDAQIAGDEDDDAIVVTGFRASVEKSIDDKRKARKIVDTINAEDIGKSTDKNIADALGRVTGVSVNSDNGEGQTISIRGSNPQQNVITFNGVTLGATDASQAVNLSSFSSNILSKVEVIKTPSADDEEGALGGLVNLVTLRPLDVAKDVAAFGGELRRSELADRWDYQISAAVSKKLFDETLGLSLNVFRETFSVRRDQFRAEDYQVRTVDQATSTSGEILNDVTGIVPFFSNYDLFQNRQTRWGADFTAQWQPSDRTNIVLNLSYNSQRFDNRQDSVRTRIGDFAPLVAGEPFQGDGRIAPESDPQADFFTFDPETRTFVKYLNRFALGDISTGINNFKNENVIGSLDFEQELSDRFRVSANIGYSRARQLPGNNIFVNAQNFRNINAFLLFNTPVSALEPAGFDCTGGPCRLVGGEGFVDYGALVEPRADLSHIWDNSSSTGFNPDDLAAQNLAFVSRTVNDIEDEQKSARLDFDWDVDFAGITRFEFGGKFTRRDKFVDTQTGTFAQLGVGQIIINPITGLPSPAPGGISDVPASFFARPLVDAQGNMVPPPVQGGPNPVAPYPTNLGVTNFLSGLGYGRDNFTDGFLTFDPLAAFTAALGTPTAEFIPDNTQTRGARLDNLALYAKANFELFNERLVGDIGLRWFQTDVKTQGFSGVQFAVDPGNVGRIFDPISLAQYRNPALAQCPAIQFSGSPEGIFFDETRFARVDGLGYNLNGTGDYRDDTPIPATNPCFDPNAVEGSPFANEFFLYRFSDVSTERNYVYDRTGGISADGRTLLSSGDRSLRSFAVTGEHSYNRFLPSLNLSYIMNDDMIVRFAASKTIARPQIDSLRPGFRLAEFQEFSFQAPGSNQPRPGNTITLFNTNLDPLESWNLDLSFEWYFKPGSLLSVGLFAKEQTNFEESQQLITYARDLRDLGLDPNDPPFDSSTLVVNEANLDTATCFPRRFQGNPNFNAGSYIYSTAATDLCNLFVTSSIVNGKGASIRGAEAQFTHSFTSLPGLLGGFGVSANYTFQDSKFDQQASTIDPNVLLPALPVTFTPRHTLNATLFWQRGGHQARLAFQSTTDVLVQRSFGSGSLWQEGRRTLDFSAAVAVHPNISFTFEGVNLTDEPVRTYFTSRFLRVGDPAAGGGAPTPFDEGNAIGGNAPKSRTVQLYNTGPIFRVGVRARF